MRNKILSIIICFCLVMSFTFSGCASSASSSAAASSAAVSSEESSAQTVNILSFTSTTIDAYVDSISGNTLQLTLGSISEGMSMGSGNSTNGNTPPSMPSGNGTSDSSGSQGNGGTPPSMPSGNGASDSSDSQNNGGTPPAMPSGNGSNDTSGSSQSDGNTPPAMPSNGTASGTSDSTESESSESTSSTGNSTNDPAAQTGQTGPSSSNTKTFVKSSTTASLLIEDESIISTENSGTSSSASLSDIKEGSVIEITIDENSNITGISILDVTVSSDSDSQGGMGVSGSSGQTGGSSNVTYTASNEYTTDTTVTGETIASTGTDENAALIQSGATVKLENDTVTRTSSDSTGGDNSSFYGIGAAVLVLDSSTAYVNGGTITTDSAGGAGAFAYGTGTLYIAGVTINTTGNTSGGIHVAGGGTLYAWDLNVTTQGNSSAAIRSDRGGGTMVVDGGTYTSNGTGSPAIYCTADIAVNDSTLTANNSEGICIEGKNSIHMFNCDLTSNMKDDSQNDTTWSVIVYQSMSGDSTVGKGTYQMVGGSLTSENGGLFYTTNTQSDILLDNVTINESSDSEFFLQCTGNTNQRGWGSSGSNGADCNFTAIDQTMSGDVIWDSISQLDFYMTGSSSLTGAVTDDETWAGNGGNGYCSMYISSGSTWTVTGNSTVTNLYNAGTIKDASGNTVSIVGTDGTSYVTGNSQYTITVTSYSTSVDLSGAQTASSFSDYSVDEPSM
jgi:hypothetical protein